MRHASIPDTEPDSPSDNPGLNFRLIFPEWTLRCPPQEEFCESGMGESGLAFEAEGKEVGHIVAFPRRRLEAAGRDDDG